MYAESIQSQSGRNEKFYTRRSPKKSNYFNTINKVDNLHQILKKKAKGYLVIFLETSSIHGLNHLVAPGRHPCEM